MPEKILLIDDDATLCRVMEYALTNLGYRVVTATSANSGLAMFHRYRPALVIADVQMPEMSGFQLFDELRKLDHNALVIFMSGSSSITDAVAAIKAGAFDYLPKPISNGHLFMIVKQAFEYRRVKKISNSSSKNVRIVGNSKIMQILKQKITRVAANQTSVLLYGESGTGKEVVARALHQQSNRADQPFVAINCAAIPKDLLESELFGHAKGSFTHAIKTRKGKFSLANKGTLFLDEIGELPLGLQPKLLRALQERVVEPVGGLPEKVDVRIIAATNLDLERAMMKGAFREDLYYRLAVIPLQLSALRERKEDIPQLINYFLTIHTCGNEIRFTDEALETLVNYSWPGNVRQLENVIEQVVVLRTGELIEVENLPPQIAQNHIFNNAILKLPEEGYPLEDIEREAIVQALYISKGNKSLAAKLLQISRHTLKYRTEKHRL